MKGKIEKHISHSPMDRRTKIEYWIGYICKDNIRYRVIEEEDMAEFMDDITSAWMLEDSRMENFEKECIKRYHERKAFEEHERLIAFQKGYEKGYKNGLAQRNLEDKLKEENDKSKRG